MTSTTQGKGYAAKSNRSQSLGSSAPSTMIRTLDRSKAVGSTEPTSLTRTDGLVTVRALATGKATGLSVRREQDHPYIAVTSEVSLGRGGDLLKRDGF